MKKAMITVNGRRMAVWFVTDADGVVYFSFAGEAEYTHRAHRDGYAYTHGGAAYRAAVDHAAELGLLAAD